jgi:hypothetical protein
MNIETQPVQNGHIVFFLTFLHLDFKKDHNFFGQLVDNTFIRSTNLLSLGQLSTINICRVPNYLLLRTEITRITNSTLGNSFRQARLYGRKYTYRYMFLVDPNVFRFVVKAVKAIFLGVQMGWGLL